LIINSIYALLATFCFGILFNIRGKNLIFAALGGGFGWFFLLIFQDKLNFSITFSLITTSVLIGIYAEIMARILKTPVTVFAICAILPLVPGNGMYYTMYESVQGNASKSLSLGIQTLASAGAIATGIVLASSTSKFINVKQSKKTSSTN